MDYTLWYAGSLIGRSDLEMATADPSARQGQVVPEPGFERAWADVGPVMKELMDLTMALGSRVSEIPDVPDETATE